MPPISFLTSEYFHVRWGNADVEIRHLCRIFLGSEKSPWKKPFRVIQRIQARVVEGFHKIIGVECRHWQFVQNRWVKNLPLSFFVKNVSIYEFFSGKIRKFGNGPLVKNLTNSTSVWRPLNLQLQLCNSFFRCSGKYTDSSKCARTFVCWLLLNCINRHQCLDFLILMILLWERCCHRVLHPDANSISSHPS